MGHRPGPVRSQGMQGRGKPGCWRVRRLAAAAAADLPHPQLPCCASGTAYIAPQVYAARAKMHEFVYNHSVSAAGAAGAAVQPASLFRQAGSGSSVGCCLPPSHPPTYPPPTHTRTRSRTRWKNCVAFGRVGGRARGGQKVARGGSLGGQRGAPGLHRNPSNPACMHTSCLPPPPPPVSVLVHRCARRVSIRWWTRSWPLPTSWASEVGGAGARWRVCQGQHSSAAREPTPVCRQQRENALLALPPACRLPPPASPWLLPLPLHRSEALRDPERFSLLDDTVLRDIERSSSQVGGRALGACTCASASACTCACSFGCRRGCARQRTGSRAGFS